MRPDRPASVGIPVSVSLDRDFAPTRPAAGPDKKRLLYIALLAVFIGGAVSVIARVLVELINLITNLFFFHAVSFSAASPAGNTLGIAVILVPMIGGLIVGCMALYGSKAIRGHGIPEAMEQILVNQSKIRPAITYLKPLSAAISIGTGGPFGSEGPIIATGGALGSTLGQVLRISSYERKVLLAAGATAGMSAIFGTPIAGIFLAIELLLFEFSARSIIPVALACITGAAGHHVFFETGPVFRAPFMAMPANGAVAIYSAIGVLMGLIASGVTRLVYYTEDLFEKLPVHWMWWPVIGGLGVGITGYFFPQTLGVGYSNITGLLSGTMTLHAVALLCIFKFVSWCIALGSGTSGGTLAPLLTIGGAAGALLGASAALLFPDAGIAPPMAALIGMAAMFAGASRALLTSIVFALETTGQSNALLPLLAACIASYVVSYFLMDNTIMTEKIARRGIHAPHMYTPDILEKIRVKEVLTNEKVVLGGDTPLSEVRAWLEEEKTQRQNHYVVADPQGEFKGIVSASSLLGAHHPATLPVQSLIRNKGSVVETGDTLQTAVKLMAMDDVDVLPVMDSASGKLAGTLSYGNVLSAYRLYFDEHDERISISLKRRALKILVHGKKKFSQATQSS